MTGRRVILIGGSGFIGTHLSRYLLEQGALPVVVDWVEPSVEGVEYHQGDFRTLADLQPGLLSGAEAIYLLAWTTKPQSANDDPAYDLETNVLAGIHFLDGVTRLGNAPRIIYISTGGAVYGNAGTDAVSEGHAVEPINAYGISKLTFERYLDLYHRTHGLDYLIFRPGNPYGEGQSPSSSQGAIAVFLGHLVRGETIEIWGDGLVVRDYLHISDLVSALGRGLKYRPDQGGPRVFNLGSGVGRSLNEVVAAIESATKREVRVEYKAGRKVDVPSIILDCSAARDFLGWTPSVEFQDGLLRTWNWLSETPLH